MATITVTLEDEVYIDPQEWFDNADRVDRLEMYELCLEYAKGLKKNILQTTIQESEFQDKLKNLQDRYLSLTPEQIKLIMSL